MYYEMYSALKAALAGVEGVEEVAWFRNQYDGAAVADGQVYVEGLAMAPAPGLKLGVRTMVQVRLHVTSAAGEGPADALLARNDGLAERVRGAVSGICLPVGEGGETRGLEVASWSYLPKVAEGLVTVIDLQARF